MTQTRYCPRRALPAYAFTPGLAPHPVNHPDGHSHGVRHRAEYLPAEHWRVNQEYLYGVDLYRFAYFWEAHEAWEGCWRVSRQDAEQAPFFKGMIQCAAACLHLKMGKLAAFRSVSSRGLGHLQTLAERRPALMGADLANYLARWRAFRLDLCPSLEKRPDLILDLRSPCR